MSLTKYFKPDQKLLLTPVPHDPAEQTIERLSTFLVDVHQERCDLRLPYGRSVNEQFPFEAEMPIVLMGESLGLGIKVDGIFERYLDPNTIRVRIMPDLQMFQRRLYPRQDRSVGIRYTKGRGTLRSYREQWRKNVALLEKSVDLSKLRGFPRNQVNLSQSGIRIPVLPPIAEADLCLLLVELEEKTPPICILAEVVWVGQADDTGRLFAGMQFLNIRKTDQQRIARFLEQKP